MAGCENGDEQSGYKKIREISLVYEEKSAYQQSLLSIELVMVTSSKYSLTF